MTTYIFEIILKDRVVITRVDAANKATALDIVKTWHPLSIIMPIN